MKVIEVIIDTQGGVSMETKGFAGIACREATQELERALGIVTRDQHTPEMFHAAQQSQHQTLKANG
jgi:hypothetical protein